MTQNNWGTYIASNYHKWYFPNIWFCGWLPVVTPTFVDLYDILKRAFDFKRIKWPEILRKSNLVNSNRTRSINIKFRSKIPKKRNHNIMMAPKITNLIVLLTTRNVKYSWFPIFDIEVVTGMLVKIPGTHNFKVNIFSSNRYDFLILCLASSFNCTRYFVFSLKHLFYPPLVLQSIWFLPTIPLKDQLLQWTNMNVCSITIIIMFSRTQIQPLNNGIREKKIRKFFSSSNISQIQTIDKTKRENCGKEEKKKGNMRCM